MYIHMNVKFKIFLYLLSINTILLLSSFPISKCFSEDDPTYDIQNQSDTNDTNNISNNIDANPSSLSNYIPPTSTNININDNTNTTTAGLNAEEITTETASFPSVDNVNNSNVNTTSNINSNSPFEEEMETN
ncbi:MAG: hypothetical protein HQK51_00245 [Oligoflexia bacterium]|nr:hypothetical protein [Oligoflexia bacterium]